MPGVMMHSGAIATVEAPVVPIADIARGLTAMPRFAGQTRRWWTVVHHSLWLEGYAGWHGCTDRTRLAILLHDAHEALTGDIPTHFKTFDLRRSQKDLDRPIMDAYFPGGYHAYLGERSFVHEYDKLGLHAEALVVGPPIMASEQGPELFNEHFFDQPHPDAVDFLNRWIAANLGLLSPGALNEPFHPAAHLYERRYTLLSKAVTC